MKHLATLKALDGHKQDHKKRIFNSSQNIGLKAGQLYDVGGLLVGTTKIEIWKNATVRDSLQEV